MVIGLPTTKLSIYDLINFESFVFLSLCVCVCKLSANVENLRQTNYEHAHTKSWLGALAHSAPHSKEI